MLASIAQAHLDPSTLLYITLLIIFLTAIITAVITKWARDKCLKFFQDYRITMERSRGQTLWGRLKVFSSGIEISYDHPYVDPMGRSKTSYMFYQQDIEQQVLSIFRWHDQLDERAQAMRLAQIHATFNPRFFRRAWRQVRNFVNTLRDAFNAAIGTVVSQYRTINPALGAQGNAVTSLGQTLLGKFANAYEPLLEQYIGQPVILEVVDPINPNNISHEYTGYLADYTQQFIAVFNVEHGQGEPFAFQLPDVERGDPLPPLPIPPAIGALAPILPPPMIQEHKVALRLDGARMKLMNTGEEALAAIRLEREGFEPLSLNTILPPMGTLNLPARDARGSRIIFVRLRCIDVVAPRKFATIRHAGILLERKGFANEFALDRLPLVSKLFGDGESK